MSENNRLDLECIRCSLKAIQLGIEIDCDNCEYYLEKLLNGEIIIEEDM